jgi:hypothetical protein
VTRDHAQRRRLAAARRAKQAAVSAAGNAQVDRIDGERIGITLRNVHELDVGGACMNHG